MSSSEHRVAIVLPESAGALVTRLAGTCHVWAVDSAENKAAAMQFNMANADDGRHPLEAGVSTFTAQSETPEDDLLGVIELVEDHHSPWEHDPGLNVLEVYGVELTDSIRAELEAWEYGRFETRADGFVAFRDAVSATG